MPRMESDSKLFQLLKVVINNLEDRTVMLDLCLASLASVCTDSEAFNAGISAGSKDYVVVACSVEVMCSRDR